MQGTWENGNFVLATTKNDEIQQLRNRVSELEAANKLLEADAKSNHDFIQKVWLAHPNVDLDIDAMENKNDNS